MIRSFSRQAEAPAAPVTIALVHFLDARDVRSWSGTLHFSRAAVERHVGRVVDLSPAPVPDRTFRAIRKVIRMGSGRHYNYDHDPVLARYFGWYFTRSINRVKPDLIYVPGGSTCIPYLKTDIPIVYFTDGPWRVIEEYSPFYRNVLKRTSRAADEFERRALERAGVVVVSSRWAEDSVVQDYGIPPEKVLNLSIGANLPHPPERHEVLPRKRGDKLRLLMVGVLWDTKGGDIAYETLLKLLEAGCDTELTVVGCAAPQGISHPKLRVIPFLNKQNAADLERFNELWRTADFFILPTRSEAAGIVFCEAAANALPALGTRTGGVPSIITEGKTGFTFPMEARGDAYAETILRVWADPERYARLCEASRDAFETRLNWDVWATRLGGAVGRTFPHLASRIRDYNTAGAGASSEASVRSQV